jgi:hypothetical protein
MLLSYMVVFESCKDEKDEFERGLFQWIWFALQSLGQKSQKLFLILIIVALANDSLIYL